MQKAQYYRERAGKMRELANTSIDVTIKRHLHAIAEKWEYLALSAERFAITTDESEQLRNLWNSA